MKALKRLTNLWLMLLMLVSCNLPRASGTSPTTQSSPGITETYTMVPSVTLQITPSTSLPPSVSVSLETNCRTGPGMAYDLVGNGLQVGETAEVVGRDSGGQFWIIRDPNNPAVTCWLWGQYASVTGDWQSLPVMTPPPTPTPAAGFSFSYNFWGIGPGYQCLLFDVVNSGEVTWESYSLTVNDTTHGDTGTTSRNEFISYDGWCSPTATLQDLTPGETGTASVVMHMVHDPGGDHFDAILTTCTGNDLTGYCLTRSISFVF